MASGKSVPAGVGPSNPWEEYSSFHEACVSVVDRAEFRRRQGVPLTKSEREELKTMAGNLAALGSLLHGKRARDLDLLAARLNRLLDGSKAAGSDSDCGLDGGESDPAAIAN